MVKILGSALVLLVVAATARTQHHLFSFESEKLGDLFGNGVAGAGDVDGDGAPDLLVGNPTDGTAAEFGGVVFVFSGRDGRQLRAWYGAAGDQLGQSVCGAGDLDGDGHDDVLASSVMTSVNGPHSGSVWAFSGRDGRTLHRFDGSSGAWLGMIVRHAGDVDRDGRPDIIAGAGALLPPGSPFVRVWSGRTGSVLHTFVQTAGSYGWAVDGAGDADGDGHADLLVGASGGGAAHGGIVWLHSGKDGSVLRSWLGETGLDRLGACVARAGDLDGDGVVDHLAGAPGLAPLGGAGFVRVFSGRDGVLLRELRGTQMGGGFGYCAAGAGDVDGDGRSDLVIGEPYAGATRSGAVHVYSGRTGALVQSFAGRVADGRFGLAVAAAGDVNADGRADVMGSQPGQFASVPGMVEVLSALPLAFSTDRHALSLRSGGGQEMLVRAGSHHAQRFYLVLGCYAGSRVRWDLGHGILLPLNPFDTYFGATLGQPNRWILASLGLLDASGGATARLTLPPGLPAALAGLALEHAFLVFRTEPLRFDLASNAAPLLLVD